MWVVFKVNNLLDILIFHNFKRLFDEVFFIFVDYDCIVFFMS